MAAWIKMPLGVEVGLGPGDFVLDEDHAPFAEKVIQRASLRFFTPQGRHVAQMGVKFGTWTEGCTRSVVFARWRQCAIIGGHCRHLANTIEPSVCGCDAPYVKLL